MFIASRKFFFLPCMMTIVPAPILESSPGPAKKGVGESGAKYKCVHKGCGKTFIDADNTTTSCVYHPGPLLPELYKCCKRTIDKPGCTIGAHESA